jgi:pyruvate formate lyase activating enzyme
VDLYTVDLKGFDDRNYRKLGGVLDNVLDTIRRLVAMNFWVEIVTLVVPGFNDGDEELKRIADFLVGVSADLPWHVTAFHPDYKMTDPPRTPASTLLRACEFGKAAGLRYIYPGNLPGQVGERESTFCPTCGQWLIRRRGFVVVENRMAGSSCPFCATKLPGVWEDHPPKCTTGAGIPLPIAVHG